MPFWDFAFLQKDSIIHSEYPWPYLPSIYLDWPDTNQAAASIFIIFTLVELSTWHSLAGLWVNTLWVSSSSMSLCAHDLLTLLITKYKCMIKITFQKVSNHSSHQNCVHMANLLVEHTHMYIKVPVVLFILDQRLQVGNEGQCPPKDPSDELHGRRSGYCWTLEILPPGNPKICVNKKRWDYCPRQGAMPKQTSKQFVEAGNGNQVIPLDVQTHFPWKSNKQHYPQDSML